MAEQRVIAPEQARLVRVSGVADSGATRLVLPESVVRQLGLTEDGTINVRYADGRVAQRTLVKNVHLTLAGRASIFNAVVEPGRQDALIGAIVMDDLDLIIDCGRTTVVPRDPTTIISEIE